MVHGQDKREDPVRVPEGKTVGSERTPVVTDDNSSGNSEHGQ